MHENQYEELCQRLAYTFKQPPLLKLALTHRSKGGEHNERLEFLGDGIVNFVVAELLYKRFPKASEGDLSRWRATLVNRETLAEMARSFELGRFVHLGVGEIRSGGQERQSILSCAMEAIIGAIYLDGGFSAVAECIELWYKPWLQSMSTSAAQHKDPKTLLQELLQGRRLPLPTYQVEAIEGEAHQQFFTVSCEVAGMKKKSLGKGTSRRRAEQEAAQAMLEMIKT